MTDAGTDKAAGLVSEMGLPPTDVVLWGQNAVLYASGSDAVREGLLLMCRIWANTNFLTVVGVNEDGPPACELPVQKRPGVLRALEQFPARNGDVLVLPGMVFEDLSAQEQEWLHANATALDGCVVVVPARSAEVAS